VVYQNQCWQGIAAACVSLQNFGVIIFAGITKRNVKQDNLAGKYARVAYWNKFSEVQWEENRNNKEGTHRSLADLKGVTYN